MTSSNASHLPEARPQHVTPGWGFPRESWGARGGDGKQVSPAVLASDAHFQWRCLTRLRRCKLIL